MHKKAEKHRSELISKLLAERDPVETEKARNRMLIAAKIDDAIKAKGWKKSQFAALMGKQPSVITKWLSGTHNFEMDTLVEIGCKLDIVLLNSAYEGVVKRYGAKAKQVVEDEMLEFSEYSSLFNQLGESIQLNIKN